MSDSIKPGNLPSSRGLMARLSTSFGVLCAWILRKLEGHDRRYFQFYFYHQDMAKARLGIFMSFRRGDWAYLDIYWYWGGFMVNLWELPIIKNKKGKDGKNSIQNRKTKAT